MTVAAINERRWRASYYLTRRCDLDCWYCCVPLVDADRRDELGAEGVTAVVGNLAGMGADLIVFTGGEAFLRADLLPVALRAARAYGVYPVVLTNGRLLVTSPRAERLLREMVAEFGQFGLSVSIDSAEAAGRRSAPRTEGSDQKSYYGLAALGVAAACGLTDLTATCILDDAAPELCLDAVRLAAGRGYGVLVNLVQRASPVITLNTTFRAGTVQPHQRLADVARALLANRDRWNLKNAPEFYTGIADGSYRRWVCGEPGLIVVQPNGQVNLCNNVRGSRLPELDLSQPHDHAALTARYDELWRRDLATDCPGCYLSCHVDFQYRHAEATP